MLEGRADRAYADLRRHYSFDLGAWLAGEDCTSVASVLAMLQHLPKNSSFMAHFTATEARNSEVTAFDDDLPEPTEEELFIQEVMERQEWGDTDLHIAKLGNLLNGIWVSVVGNKEFSPELVGPDFMLGEVAAKERRDKRRKEYLKQREREGQKAHTVEGLYKLLGSFTPPPSGE